MSLFRANGAKYVASSRMVTRLMWKVQVLCLFSVELVRTTMGAARDQIRAVKAIAIFTASTDFK